MIFRFHLTMTGFRGRFSFLDFLLFLGTLFIYGIDDVISWILSDSSDIECPVDSFHSSIYRDRFTMNFTRICTKMDRNPSSKFGSREFASFWPQYTGQNNTYIYRIEHLVQNPWQVPRFLDDEREPVEWVWKRLCRFRGFSGAQVCVFRKLHI